MWIAPAAMTSLTHAAGEERQTVLKEFYEQWKDESLVVLKWLGIQTSSNIPGNLAAVKKLLDHPAVNLNNPNTNYTGETRHWLTTSTATLILPCCGVDVFGSTDCTPLPAVFLGFVRSPVNFHAADGSGYQFIADSILKVGVTACASL